MGPLISVVIPVYNEALRITASLERVIAYLRPRYPFEILVVDDGSLDETPVVVKAYAKRHPEIRITRWPHNRGKGAAVRAGMLSASGALVCFIDADLAIPIEELEQAMPLLRDGCEVVIASRTMPGSRIAGRKDWRRRATSEVFNQMVRALFRVRFRDTQCGFKCFRREAAVEIFSRTTVDGFAFDVEVLIVADVLGYTIREIPVRLEGAGPSSVRLTTHSYDICKELWRIARNLRRTVYQSASLSEDAGVKVRLASGEPLSLLGSSTPDHVNTHD